MVYRIAVFASGSGSNAENVAQYFLNSNLAKVVLILTNNKCAGVLERAERLKIDTFIFSNEELINTDKVLNVLKNHKIDFIVLGGFLRKIPKNITDFYSNKIVNIHPALLPKYGGKGMYGHFVHEAVAKANETESGITIHYVNEYYDEGDIIAQYKCKINGDTADVIEQKVRALELKYYPSVIDSILKKSKYEFN